MAKKSVRYVEVNGEDDTLMMETFLAELLYLNGNKEIETTFIILTQSCANFESYLGVVDKAERLLTKHHYDGIYQLASFHPQYCFAGTTEKDAANYTNRSPYPMLHILREDSITNALKHFENPESIPEKNIAFAREKGLAFMKGLLERNHNVD